MAASRRTYAIVAVLVALLAIGAYLGARSLTITPVPLASIPNADLTAYPDAEWSLIGTSNQLCEMVNNQGFSGSGTYSLQGVKFYLASQGIGTVTLSVWPTSGYGYINPNFQDYEMQVPASLLPSSPAWYTFDTSGHGDWTITLDGNQPGAAAFCVQASQGASIVFATPGSAQAGHWMAHIPKTTAEPISVTTPTPPPPHTDTYYDLAMVVNGLLVPPPGGVLSTDFTWSSSGCTATFASSVSGGTTPYAYEWTFHDINYPTTSTAQNPKHTFPTGMTQAVVDLAVTDSGSPKQSASVTHTIGLSGCGGGAYQIPQVSINASVHADQKTVDFTAAVANGAAPFSYAWDFGDAATSTQGPTVTHVYSPSTASQTYSVSLKLTDAHPTTVGASTTITLTQTTPPPTATFSYTMNYLSGTFTGAISGGTPPYAYNWNFGDGMQSNGSAGATHAYALGGNYDVTFTVKDAKGLSGSQTRTVSAIPAPPKPAPLGNVTFTSTAVGNETILFTGSATGGNGTLKYSWDFGDGKGSSYQSPAHQYAATGTYTVVYTVTDSTGTTLTSSQKVTVKAATTGGALGDLVLIAYVALGVVGAGLVAIGALARRRAPVAVGVALLVILVLLFLIVSGGFIPLG